MSRTDRIIGIVLGLIVGVVAVVLFVFSGGGESLDAPSLDQEGSAGQQLERPAPAGSAGGEEGP